MKKILIALSTLAFAIACDRGSNLLTGVSDAVTELNEALPGASTRPKPPTLPVVDGRTKPFVTILSRGDVWTFKVTVPTDYKQLILAASYHDPDRDLATQTLYRSKLTSFKGTSTISIEVPCGQYQVDVFYGIENAPEPPTTDNTLLLGRIGSRSCSPPPECEGDCSPPTCEELENCPPPECEEDCEPPEFSCEEYIGNICHGVGTNNPQTLFFDGIPPGHCAHLDPPHSGGQAADSLGQCN